MGRETGKTRDVTSLRFREFPDYAMGYAAPEAEVPFWKPYGIPVDNSEFSTLSTALSTGVFHNYPGLWIFIAGFT